MKKLANIWSSRARVPSASYPFVPTVSELQMISPKKTTTTTNKAQKCSGSSVPLGNSRGIGAGGDVSFSLSEQAGEQNAVVRYSGSWFPCEAAALRRGRGREKPSSQSNLCIASVEGGGGGRSRGTRRRRGVCNWRCGWGSNDRQ